MIKNYDLSVEINHNLNWPYIPDHPYRILIIGVLVWETCVTELIYALLNLIKHQRPDLSVKDPFESKYQLIINGIKK